MNNRFPPTHSHNHQPFPPFYPAAGYPIVGSPQQGDFGYSDPNPVPFYSGSSPQQGDFGYSDPTRSRSVTPTYARGFRPCCPSPIFGQSPVGTSPYLAQPPSRGIYPERHLQPGFQPALPQHTPNFVRRDSYWSNLQSPTIYGVQQKVARKFVDYRNEHKKAKRVALRERPLTMSSSTALLPKNPDQKRGDQHPIFLRVCHSPWLFIGQKALVFLRGVTAAYLTASFLMDLQYDLQINKHGWLTAFELPNIVSVLQIIYHWLAFTWTSMHLYYPHHGSQIQTNSTRFQKIFSPPRQNPTTKNRTFFSIFYYATVTYPLVVAFIHWAILVPKHETTIPANEMFSNGWYTQFFILNKYAIGSVIALLEVFVYSSIKRADPVHAHISGLPVLSLLYIGWSFVGYVVTDKYHYYFFDHKKVGWKHVGAAAVAFLVVTNIFFAVIYGITGLREKLTKRGEERKSGGGYTRLPQ